MTAPRILIIVTSHAELGSTGKKTGFWLEELAVPYRELTGAGAQVDIALAARRQASGRPWQHEGTRRRDRGVPA